MACVLLSTVLVAACAAPRTKPNIAAPGERIEPGASSAALDLLAEDIGDARLVLVGETHGTREIPALVGDLLARDSADGAQATLALEIDAGEQARIDRYLDSAGQARDRAALLAGAHWRDAMHDGRDSAAMFGLIERVRVLRAAGRTVSIALFDPGMPDRDRRMADRLRALVRTRPDARVLALMGNTHAMTSASPWEMLDEAGHRIAPPMTAGRFLADLQPLSIEIDAAQGDAWNCGQGGCGAHPVLDRGARTAPALARNAPAQSPWQATLRLPRFSASPPAITVDAVAP